MERAEKSVCIWVMDGHKLSAVYVTVCEFHMHHEGQEDQCLFLSNYSLGLPLRAPTPE